MTDILRAMAEGFGGEDETDSRTVYTFTVPGPPRPWKAPDVFRGKTKEGRTFTRGVKPERTRTYQSRVALFASQSCGSPIRGPVTFILDIYLHRPKKFAKDLKEWQNHPGRVPCPKKVVDLGNVEKAVEDALQGIAYMNDAQIVRKHTAKWYHEIDGAPRAEITVKEWRNGG